jgi:hypothetical protein
MRLGKKGTFIISAPFQTTAEATKSAPGSSPGAYLTVFRRTDCGSIA